MADENPTPDAPVGVGEDTEDYIDKVMEQCRKEVYDYRGQRYTVHPAAHLFPLEQGEKFNELVESVRQFGVRHPVLLLGTQIVDGRNRLRAAIAADADVEFVQLKPGDDPYRVASLENLTRRDLLPAQRAVIASQLARMARRDAREQTEARAPSAESPHAAGSPDVQPADPGDGSAAASGDAAGSAAASADAGGDAGASADAGDAAGGAGAVPEADASSPGGLSLPSRPEKPAITQAEAAELAGVNRDLVRQVDRVIDDAPELEGELASGSLSVRDALAVRKEDPALRRQAVEDVKAGRAPTASAAVEKRTGRAPKASRKRSRETGPRASGGASSDGVDSLPPLPSVGGAGKADPAPPATPAVGQPPKPVALPPTALSPVLLMAGVRVCLGIIDLDPCSSEEAQLRVEATDLYSRDDDGLGKPWTGTCYVFPPPALAAGFASKLVGEMVAGRVTKAAFHAPAALDEEWAGLLMSDPRFSGLVVAAERERYELEDGTAVTAGRRMATFLFGVDQPSVVSSFEPVGIVLLPPVKE